MRSPGCNVIFVSSGFERRGRQCNMNPASAGTAGARVQIEVGRQSEGRSVSIALRRRAMREEHVPFFECGMSCEFRGEGGKRTFSQVVLSKVEGKKESEGTRRREKMEGANQRRALTSSRLSRRLPPAAAGSPSPRGARRYRDPMQSPYHYFLPLGRCF